ncbi:hypothetical protein CIRG_06980 [Coccidioides immitis RMSCC 2394]|uniref:Uncharacterized protein n=1 Tax=Coccidioides immitis RMSCC 2394 TaxID=404692 RepID=A0A0J6YJM4_COCIT|nr:hypothetical protein CIRG_06980 [Coccidioides immitis RMSCC 2394]
MTRSFFTPLQRTKAERGQHFVWCSATTFPRPYEANDQCLDAQCNILVLHRRASQLTHFPPINGSQAVISRWQSDSVFLFGIQADFRSSLTKMPPILFQKSWIAPSIGILMEQTNPPK